MVPSSSATVRYMVSALVWSSDWAAAVVGKPCVRAALAGGEPGGTCCASASLDERNLASSASDCSTRVCSRATAGRAGICYTRIKILGTARREKH